jgi:hypothetical protein
MSRRHSSSRRRNYGRRQHEVRERRPEANGSTDFYERISRDDWDITDVDEPRTPGPIRRDTFGSAQP